MNALLIIDPQNSFCKPGGELYVPGAEKDMQRLADWIRKNKANIDYMLVSLDTHHYNDISHPNFWRNPDGKKPAPFTQITYSQVIEGQWLPIFEPERVKEYLRRLEQQGEYKHTIWPEHCLVGSEGAAIYKPLLDAILEWSDFSNKNFVPLIKGLYPFSEHFGIFAAQVQFDDVPETQIRKDLLDELFENETIVIAGEARSHCVATTIKQILQYKADNMDKVVLLDDATSNVPGFEHIADDIYKQAENLGMKFSSTQDLVL